eukprot:3755616-Prymnesium_polylepis.2
MPCRTGCCSSSPADGASNRRVYAPPMMTSRTRHRPRRSRCRHSCMREGNLHTAGSPHSWETRRRRRRAARPHSQGSSLPRHAAGNIGAIHKDLVHIVVDGELARGNWRWRRWRSSPRQEGRRRWLRTARIHVKLADSQTATRGLVEIQVAAGRIDVDLQHHIGLDRQTRRGKHSILRERG